MMTVLSVQVSNVHKATTSPIGVPSSFCSHDGNVSWPGCCPTQLPCTTRVPRSTTAGTAIDVLAGHLKNAVGALLLFAWGLFKPRMDSG